VEENVRAIADAFGRMVNDVTAIVLTDSQPPRSDRGDQASGARIKLIQDGDVTVSISAAVRGTNDHLAIGIGGTRQAVLAAAALRCLGGELQAQLCRPAVPRSSRRASTASRTSTASSPPTTSPPGGDRRRDRRLERRSAHGCALPGSARTHSIVMCTRCNWVRFVDGIHFFTRDRREEVRLS
jgi:fructose-1,6-bisphosphatase II